MKRPSAKQRVRFFFLQNIGKVVTSKQIRDAVGTDVSEWARRVRELRRHEGWKILTQRDTPNLKPNEYLLKEKPPASYDIRFERGVSAKTRAFVLDRNGFTCQSCGITPSEIDPHTGRPVRLQVAHRIDKSLGGTDDPSNLVAQCTTCNEGSKNITLEKPTFIWLISQIRRAPIGVQQQIFAKLKENFDSGNTK